MPTILERLAEQIKLARRGLEGDDDALTQHPVRLFAISGNPEDRHRFPTRAPASPVELYQQFDRRLGDMGNLMRTIRDEPRYQSGLNILIPQESLLTSHPGVKNDVLQSVPRARHKGAINQLSGITSPYMLTAFHGNYSKPFDPTRRAKHLAQREAEEVNTQHPSSLLAALRGQAPVGDVHKSRTSFLGGGTEIARLGKWLNRGEHIPEDEHFLPGIPELKFNQHYYATDPAGYRPVVSDDMQADIQKLLGLSVCADFGDCRYNPHAALLRAHAHQPSVWALQSDSVRPTRRDWQTGVRTLVQADPHFNLGLMRVADPELYGRDYEPAVPPIPLTPFGSLQYQQYTMTPEIRDRFPRHAKRGGRMKAPWIS